MSGKRVIELRDVAIYHAENPFGRQSAERLVRSGELVLSEVDFSVEEGEFVYLIGRVGSGKSTLLKTLYADVQLLVGEGCVVGFDLRKLRRRQIPYLRRKIGIVFQDYQLLTDRNVFQNLYYVMRATGWRAEAEIRRRIDEVLQLVGLEAKHYKMPFELSGGEQQRLVIARALLNKPRLLLADEPTHNTNLIEEYPARTLVFEKGRVKEVDMQALLGRICPCEKPADLVRRLAGIAKKSYICTLI